MESVKIDLFDPGMSPLHRAGLGGLACTFRAWESVPDKSPQESRILENCQINDRSVTIQWDRPTDARETFGLLYNYAFGIDGDGLINLPGSRGSGLSSIFVKAALQSGLLRTILQHGKSRTIREEVTKTFEMDGRKVVSYRAVSDYVHRNAWKQLTKPDGSLRQFVAVQGNIAPGSVRRHEAFANTTMEQPVGFAVALHFALVGTISLTTSHGRAILIVPDVTNLGLFWERRACLNPKSERECCVASPADAALQAQVRLRRDAAQRTLEMDRCLAVLFSSQNWITQQKTRAAVFDVNENACNLKLFGEAMQLLAPRLVPFPSEKEGGSQEIRVFDSKIRPLIAENLASGRKWYEGFRRLLVSSGGETSGDKLRSLSFERENLHTMINHDACWDDSGERDFVVAIHEAMRSRFSDVFKENENSESTAYSRIEKLRLKWRLKLANAKTADEVRSTLSDLWSRSKYNPTLQRQWERLLRLICDDTRWQLNRDLALLAMASYRSSNKADDANEESSSGLLS